jgi:hypothetical protein
MHFYDSLVYNARKSENLILEGFVEMLSDRIKSNHFNSSKDPVPLYRSDLKNLCDEVFTKFVDDTKISNQLNAELYSSEDKPVKRLYSNKELKEAHQNIPKIVKDTLASRLSDIDRLVKEKMPNGTNNEKLGVVLKDLFEEAKQQQSLPDEEKTINFDNLRLYVGMQIMENDLYSDPMEYNITKGVKKTMNSLSVEYIAELSNVFEEIFVGEMNAKKTEYKSFVLKAFDDFDIEENLKQSGEIYEQMKKGKRGRAADFDSSKNYGNGKGAKLIDISDTSRNGRY